MNIPEQGQHPRHKKIALLRLIVSTVLIAAAAVLIFVLVFRKGYIMREISIPGFSVKLDAPKASQISTEAAPISMPNRDYHSTFGTSQFVIPSEATIFYVIFQERGKEGVDGSSKSLMVPDRNVFLQELAGYILQAKRENMKLVVTAATSGEQRWVHSQIKYKNMFLVPSKYHDPGSSKTQFGVEIPLD